MAFSAKTYVEEPRGGGSKIPVGINLVNFDGLSRDTGWWDLKYSNAEGRSIHTRLFNPDASKTRELKNAEGETSMETPAQALDRQQRNNFKHVVYVMGIVAPEAVDKFTAETYEAFMLNASKLFEKSKGTKLYLKVVPDYKNNKYPEISSYTGYLELYKGQETTLEFSKKEAEAIEKMLGQRETEKGSKLPAAFPEGDVRPGELPF